VFFAIVAAILSVFLIAVLWGSLNEIMTLYFDKVAEVQQITGHYERSAPVLSFMTNLWQWLAVIALFAVLVWLLYYVSYRERCW